MTDLYIVRHGNTFEAGEAPSRIGARTDLPLTATGVTQARALGRHFAEVGVTFSRVLSSPLRRTAATAGAILQFQALPADIETADFLTEIDHGPDENRLEPAVTLRIGAAALAAWDRAAVAPPGWQVDADRRVAAWREFIAGAADADTILLVTSNGAARFALVALGLVSSGQTANVKLATGTYGIIRVGADASPALVEWNKRPD